MVMSKLVNLVLVGFNLPLGPDQTYVGSIMIDLELFMIRMKLLKLLTLLELL